ncbi:unnamed protein product [Arabidopsis thaliana]|uniref:Uncharacterized protein n=1 Tax=Arabidopsis thaliana TaxID=3702 RepID=A0A654EXZ5_ARATH|nr:unnamed protein product [Arabidopsis thaliana]
MPTISMIRVVVGGFFRSVALFGFKSCLGRQPVVVGLNWLLRSDVRVRGWLGLRNQDVEGAQDVVKIKELRKALKSLLRIKAEGASNEVNLGAAEGAQDVVKIKELRKALKSLLRIKAEGASNSDFFFSGKFGVLDRYTPT